MAVIPRVPGSTWLSLGRVSSVLRLLSVHARKLGRPYSAQMPRSPEVARAKIFVFWIMGLPTFVKWWVSNRQRERERGGKMTNEERLQSSQANLPTWSPAWLKGIFHPGMVDDPHACVLQSPTPSALSIRLSGTHHTRWKKQELAKCSTSFGGERLSHVDPIWKFDLIWSMLYFH